MRNEITRARILGTRYDAPLKFGIGRCEVSDCEPSFIGALSSRERLGGFV